MSSSWDRYQYCQTTQSSLSPSAYPPRVGLSRITFKNGNTEISCNTIAYKDRQTTAVHGCRQRTLLEAVDTSIEVRNHISEKDAQAAEEAESLNAQRSTRRDSMNCKLQPGYQVIGVWVTSTDPPDSRISAFFEPYTARMHRSGDTFLYKS